MTISLDLSPDAEAKLRAKAASLGKNADEYVREVIEHDLAAPPSLKELMAEIHAETAIRGAASEEELDAEIEQCRNEVYAERQAKQRQGQ